MHRSFLVLWNHYYSWDTNLCEISLVGKATNLNADQYRLNLLSNVYYYTLWGSQMYVPTTMSFVGKENTKHFIPTKIHNSTVHVHPC